MLPLRLTAEEWDQLQAAAAELGMKVAVILREGARLYIQTRDKDGSSKKGEMTNDSSNISARSRIKSNPDSKRNRLQNPISHPDHRRKVEAPLGNSLRAFRQKGSEGGTRMPNKAEYCAGARVH